MAQLPRSSRVIQRLSIDPLTFEQHALLSILDALNQTAYFSMINARRDMTSEGWQKVVKNVPQTTPRPGQEPIDNKRVQHVRARDGHMAIEQFKRNVLLQRSLADRA